MVGQERPNRPCESSVGWRKASPGAQSWWRKPQMAASSGGNRQAVQGPQRGRGRIAMKVDGGCHCGKIRYEAEVDPGNVLICHCTDCQTMSRSAFRTVVPSNAGSLRLLSGTSRVYVKTAEIGRRRMQTCCANCGSPIYSATGDGDTKVVGLRVGTIRQRDQLIPSDQYWVHSLRPWLQHLARIKKRQEQPSFDPKGGWAEC